MGKLEAARHVWQFMSPLGTFWRFHQVVRSLLMPFPKLLGYLPEQNSTSNPLKLLDLGCGHGLFLALAKRERPDLQLMGIDLSQEKIVAARKLFENANGLVEQLAVMDIADFPEQSADVITIVDVLYLVPLDRWNCILKRCFSCLKPGGRLLLKEMNRLIRWKFVLLYLEETLAVNVLGLTLGEDFTFPKPQEIRYRLEQAGFGVEEIPLHRGYFAPHQLWVGHKQAA